MYSTVVRALENKSGSSSRGADDEREGTHEREEHFRWYVQTWRVGSGTEISKWRAYKRFKNLIKIKNLIEWISIAIVNLVDWVELN